MWADHREGKALLWISLRFHLQQILVLFEDTERFFKVYLLSTL